MQLGEGQFTLRLKRARDFTLLNPELVITYNSQTRWKSEEGQPASPNLLQVGMEVEVKGVVQTQGVLQAHLIELEIED